MKKLKEWAKKPITRGDYAKWCLASLIISGACGIGGWAYFKREERKWKEELDKQSAFDSLINDTKESEN